MLQVKLRKICKACEFYPTAFWAIWDDSSFVYLLSGEEKVGLFATGE